MNTHVLMVIDSLRVGGAERIVLTLAELFVQKDIYVDIIGIYDYVEYTIPEGVTIHNIGFKKRVFQNILYSQSLKKKIAELEVSQGKEYDLILVHLLKAARLMQNFKHKNLYYVLHSTMSQESLAGLDGAKRKRKLKRLKKKFEDKNIITVSQGISIDLLKTVKIKPSTLQVIYNPIDVDSIIAQSKAGNLYVNEKPYIVHLGRLVQVKRHDRLLAAFKRSDIDAKLILIGEGEYRKSIEEKVLLLGLEERVIFAGMQINPYPIIADARLLVLSSDYEGLSMAILEALALDVPVVSTDCPSGPREILEGYLDNALVPLGETKTLAKMIKKQYTEPSRIFSDVLNRFEGQHIIEQYINLIK